MEEIRNDKKGEVNVVYELLSFVHLKKSKLLKRGQSFEHTLPAIKGGGRLLRIGTKAPKFKELKQIKDGKQ